jgi:hypothetical protein
MCSNKLVAAAMVCCFPNMALADITVVMNKYPHISKVQIYKGNAVCGSIDNSKVYTGPVDRGANGYRLPVPDAGTNKNKVCLRRSDPPDNKDKDPDMTLWKWCISDGECEID